MKPIYLAGLLFLGIQIWAQPKLTSVEFIVCDGFGLAVPGEVSVVVSTKGSTLPDTIIKFPATRSIRLPSGEYFITATAKGFLRSTVTFAVGDRDLVVPVTLDLAPVEGTRPILANVSGMIAKRFGQGNPTWVRAIGVFNGLNENVPVREDGTFLLQKIPPGKYLFLVVNGGNLIESREIDIRAFDNTVNIE